MNIGRQAITIVKMTLGMSNATCERLISRMKDENSELYKAMNKAGARRRGRGHIDPTPE